MRGFDYRSHENTEGIALLVASTFSSKRAYLQGLGRCGRYGDVFKRAILNGIEPFEDEKLATTLLSLSEEKNIKD